MTEWEYLFRSGVFVNDMNVESNRLGKDGWELIHIVTDVSSCGRTMIFKRHKAIECTDVDSRNVTRFPSHKVHCKECNGQGFMYQESLKISCKECKGSGLIQVYMELTT